MVIGGGPIGDMPIAGSPWVYVHPTILQTAKQLLDQAHHGPAVVVAQTACEVTAESLLTEAAAKKAMTAMYEVIADSIKSYNFRNELVKRLYEVLTGDSAILASPFWEKHLAAVKLRNEVVHFGKRPTQQQAEEACKAADALIQYLEAIRTKL